MNYIESEEQYLAAMARIEELLPIVKEDTPEDDENYLELVRLSYMVAVSLNLRCKMLFYLCVFTWFAISHMGCNTFTVNEDFYCRAGV